MNNNVFLYIQYRLLCRKYDEIELIYFLVYCFKKDFLKYMLINLLNYQNNILNIFIYVYYLIFFEIVFKMKFLYNVCILMVIVFNLDIIKFLYVFM